jgi:hypothetical protein
MNSNMEWKDFLQERMNAAPVLARENTKNAPSLVSIKPLPYLTIFLHSFKVILLNR